MAQLRLLRPQRPGAAGRARSVHAHAGLRLRRRRALGENIAAGQQTPSDVMDGLAQLAGPQGEHRGSRRSARSASASRSAASTASTGCRTSRAERRSGAAARAPPPPRRRPRPRRRRRPRRRLSRRRRPPRRPSRRRRRSLRPRRRLASGRDAGPRSRPSPGRGAPRIGSAVSRSASRKVRDARKHKRAARGSPWPSPTPGKAYSRAHVIRPGAGRDRRALAWAAGAASRAALQGRRATSPATSRPARGRSPPARAARSSSCTVKVSGRHGVSLVRHAPADRRRQTQRACLTPVSSAWTPARRPCAARRARSSGTRCSGRGCRPARCGSRPRSAAGSRPAARSRR